VAISLLTCVGADPVHALQTDDTKPITQLRSVPNLPEVTSNIQVYRGL
jgi:hypothetical protein